MKIIRKKHPDINELAAAIVVEATEEEKPEQTPSNKNPHAVALGRLGGLKGGIARSMKLTKKQRSNIAKKAAKTRWKKNQ